MEMEGRSLSGSSRANEEVLEQQMAIQDLMRRLEMVEMELVEAREQARRVEEPPLRVGNEEARPRVMEEPQHEVREEELRPRLRGEVRRENEAMAEGEIEEEELEWEHVQGHPRVRPRSRSPRIEMRGREPRGGNGGRDYEHQGGRGHGHHNRLDLRVDLPEFDGKGGAESFIDWLQTVDRTLEIKELEGPEIVKLVALKLRGYASLW